ncbi:MAG: NAD-dependent dehydratase [Alphaproteobacteria bacterium]|nr:NAD-dependent dehydratase [Alphaproteobacteria bacterium]
MSGSLLLIGATGQIGRNILTRSGDRAVLALARHPERLPAGADVTVQKFDAVGPLPAMTGRSLKNAIATVPVWLLPPRMDELYDAGVRRLVCFSTTSVLGKADSQNPHERAMVTKVMESEFALHGWSVRKGVGLTILRPTLIYGAGRDQTVSAAVRFILRFGLYPVWGEASGLRQPVHADDLAAAALTALEAREALGGTFALGGGETLTYREMITRIFEVLERSPRLVRVPALPSLLSLAGAVIPGSQLTADVARRMAMDLAYDDGEAAAAFGYAPRPFLSGGRSDLFGADS